jgi:hypothetical protein
LVGVIFLAFARALLRVVRLSFLAAPRASWVA